MFIKNSWYVAAWASELQQGKLLPRKLLNEKVLLYRGADDKVVAIEDRCCHRGVPLSLGRLEGNCVRCMYHGLVFDSSGRCVEVPGQDTISPSLKVKSYKVDDSTGLIWIWMGDPALADVATIPGFAYLNKPGWHGKPDYLHYDANYLLIADNLADITHIAYVHTNTLGGSESYIKEHTQSPLERAEDGFKLTKWHKNSDLPPFAAKVKRATGKVDRWNTVQMKLPALFYLESGFGPAGQDPANNREGVLEFRNFQAMTPETDTMTHFFWIYMHNQTQDIEQISESLHASILEGFYEDKIIIETQQTMLDGDPGFKFKALAADAPLSYFRWLIDKRLKAETSAVVQAAA
jgi:phenylpropionate dioxygenase-like ring-hydroxylating dioxygenase large terminal subunit